MSGIIKVSAKGYQVVTFSHLTWMKSRYQKDKIVQYFNDQGYAEAEEIAYLRIDDGLFVNRDLPELGFAIAVIADEAIAAIPF